MRIIGGHDYYDGAAMTWRDETIVWDRTQVATEAQEQAAAKLLTATQILTRYHEKDASRTQRRTARHIHASDVWQVTYPVVLFAGAIYRGISIHLEHAQHSYTLERKDFWKKADFDAWIEEVGLVEREHRVLNYLRDERRQPFHVHELTGEDLRLAIDHRLIVAMRQSDTHANINDVRLADHGFTKALDAHQAAQALAEWVGNRLTEPDPAKLQVSDEIRIAKHGFDKMSFRRPKQG